MEGWNGEGADQVPAVSSYLWDGPSVFLFFLDHFVSFRMGFGEYPKALVFVIICWAYTLYMSNEHRCLA